jgi:hypothetical protein
MKTLKLICLALLFTTTVLQAQITKGNWMVGGTANYNNNSFESSSNGVTSKSKGSGLIVSPTIGYFPANNFACGLSVNFGLSMPERGDNVTSYGIGPFARYYFLKPEKTVNLLAQVDYSYSITPSSDSKSSNLGFKAGPVVYFNSSVGLEFTVNYFISRGSSPGFETTNKGLNVGFGFQIHLEK